LSAELLSVWQFLPLLWCNGAIGYFGRWIFPNLPPGGGFWKVWALTGAGCLLLFPVVLCREALKRDLLGQLLSRKRRRRR
jgi:hypothetical protein